MVEIDLQFLSRQLALLLEGQREIRTRIATISDMLVDIKDTHAGTAIGDPIERLLQAFEEGTDPAEARSIGRRNSRMC